MAEVEDAGQVERKLAAILAADVVGYSRLMERDEVGTLRALQRHRQILDRLIAEHRGRIFTTAGDSVMAEFPSAVEAVECAVAAQAALAREDAEHNEPEPMRFRIGVHLGDVIVEGDNLFGDGINIAFRLQALARPGGICISNAVREQVGARLPLSLVDLGAQRVKNIAVPVRAFRIGGGPAPVLRLGRRGLAAVAAVLLLAVGVGLWRLWPAPLPGAPGPAAVVAGPAAPRPAPRLSLVVLPFANLSDDPGEEYFADGVTEDLTTDLSRLEGSLVISASTARTYKGKPLDAKRIGAELGVRYLVEGSVRRADNRVRINVQLVDAATGAELWADRFDRDTGELLQLQNEITARIARALQVQLAVAEARRPVAHPDSLDYILRGRAQLTKPVSRENYAAAVRLFSQALTSDPQSPDAKTWLAAVLAVRALDELSATPDEDLRRAGQLVDQALESDPNSALAHHVKGQVLRAQGRCAEAIPEYQAAIALDRSRAPSYAHLGWCKFLTGEIEPAIADLEQAIRLSPYEPGIAAWQGRLGIIRLLQGDTDAAVDWLNKALSTNDRLPFLHAFLAAAYGLKGYTELAGAQLAVAQSLSQTYRSLQQVEKANWYDNPKIRAMAERTYFLGLRRAGMPGV
jgi:adenylate cyclase